MKDIKNIIIVILLAGLLIFGYIAIFGGDSNYKQQLKELKTKNELLEKQRDSIDVVINNLHAEYAKLKVREAELAKEVTALDAEVEQNKANAKRSQAELDIMKRDLKETRRKIEELKKHPANREGDDLINSLKLKTTK